MTHGIYVQKALHFFSGIAHVGCRSVFKFCFDSLLKNFKLSTVSKRVRHMQIGLQLKGVPKQQRNDNFSKQEEPSMALRWPLHD